MDRFLYFVLHIFLLIVGVTTRAANKYFDSRCSIAASLEHIIKLILKINKINWKERICQDLQLLGWLDGETAISVHSPPEWLLKMSPHDWKMRVRERLLKMVTIPEWRKRMRPIYGAMKSHLDVLKASPVESIRALATEIEPRLNKLVEEEQKPALQTHRVESLKREMIEKLNHVMTYAKDEEQSLQAADVLIIELKSHETPSAQRRHLALYGTTARDPVYADYCIPDTNVVTRKKEYMVQGYLKDTEDQKDMRQFHTLLRAGSLPLQTYEHRYFRCGGTEATGTCFVCGRADEDLDHFMNQCSGYDDIKSQHRVVRPFNLRLMMLMPGKSKQDISVLFQMWRKRVRLWRRAHPEQVPCQPLFS